MTDASELLVDLLQPKRLTAVVDIGANPITDIPPYQAMLGKRLCSLVGFEPQAEGLASLNAQKSDLETYLPYAVGDGKPATLRLCHAPGMSSLLAPNPQVLNCLALYSIFGMVTGEQQIETHRLDDISEITAIDFLKIDVQGSELSIFRNGHTHLANAVAVHTEVCFMQLYKDQPLFGDIDRELRSLGMIPHIFAEIKKAMILPIYYENDLYRTMNHALYTDIVYVRDFTQPDNMTAEQLKHLALVAHYCYQSFDLAAKCIRDLQLRNAIAADSVTRYIAAISGK
jgi:FkbM family methyltransferase